jgi:flavin-dependent dehydrogenase
LVVDRQSFDRRCAEIATDAGAKIFTGSHLTRAIIRPEGVEARFLREARTEKCSADLIVGADGYKSRVSEIANLPPARERVKGIQVDLDVKESGDELDVYVGSKVAPGFFAWRIPCGDFVRVGVCISQGNGIPSQYLRSLLKRLELDDAAVIERISGVIPIGFPSRTYANRTLLVGDAAGQAKPLSGGGLYTGMTAAHIAAEVAVAALKEGDLSADRLSEYQRKWREEIGRELERGYLIRRAYLRLSDKRLEALGRTLDRPEVKEVLSTGDIDFPSMLASQIIKAAPKLLRFAPQVLRSMFSRAPTGRV